MKYRSKITGTVYNIADSFSDSRGYMVSVSKDDGYSNRYGPYAISLQDFIQAFERVEE